MEQNLSLYRIFYEVAQTGNISRAAKNLYISQPAISKAISKLEDSLDPSAGSDNFAEFLAAFPGFYMNLGSHSSRPGTSGNHHNPTFDVDESVFKKDVELFVVYTQRFLA